MKISDSWLREWVRHTLAPDDLADLLTMLGLEVDSVTRVGHVSGNVVIGQVLEAKRHPGADRLTICRVDVGRGNTISVVCGAPNVRAGGIYATALPGAQLPRGLTIRATRIRGESSEGMLCSASELGLEDESAGLLELDPGLVTGADACEILQLGDVVLDLNVTPNRADCFSVRGVAREVSAALAVELAEQKNAIIPAVTDESLAVRVEEPADCPRFAGRIIRGVDPVMKTPLWMRERLRRVGVRPISLVVDVTNYVMMETGQPMHAYDLGRLEQTGIVVRRARAGESVRLLDGMVAMLDADMLVIADDHAPIGLAGIMGGDSTAVCAGSANVFLESAFFTPAAIAGRARRLGRHTDASLRFERGVDPSGQVRAIERATALITSIAGGSPGPVTDLHSEMHVPQRVPVRLRRSRLSRVLGTDAPCADVDHILPRLGMTVESDADGWVVTPSAARFDVEREEDLIEEVARVYGYQRIPAAPGTAIAHLAGAGEEADPLAVLRATLVARGFQEVITYSFIGADLSEKFGAKSLTGLTLTNPISAEMAVMRQSLWPGLAQAACANVRRQQPRVRLFEIGTRFSENGEETRVAGLVVGARYPEQWGIAPARADVFDIKGDLEALLALAGKSGDVCYESRAHPALHPGRSAAVLIGGKRIGWVGEIHPALGTDMELAAASLFEVSASALFQKARPAYSAISKFPAVRRDLAIVVSREVATAVLIDVIREAASPLLREVSVFDIYMGPQIASTEKSIAIGLILQDTCRTLTDEEADATLQRTRSALVRELQATFRE
ncbi:MAG: phenylalanine--tRNA ligase subunit beta [Gammaproteobacteria bacterium]|nr:phenylalanine--tRNA ligase subunit beta [Gammaproteobacteria bacterium]